MHLRPYRPDDLPAVTAVQRAYDTAWFGEPEHDTDEVRDWLKIAEAACVVEGGGRVVAAGNRWRTGSSVVIDPAAASPALTQRIVAWLSEVDAPDTETLDRDDVLRSALEAAGWGYAYSTFDLLRPVGDDWMLGAPEWPAGVDVRRLAPGEDEALHHLIYAGAGWAEVAGHHYRDHAEWRHIFLDGRRPEEAPIVAWRGDRPVGTALLRLFSDGTGWIAQLAVDRDERGQGLGRALLLDGFRRLVADGASKLGLAVIATNRAALQLYLGLGLRVDREWQTYAVGPLEEPLPAQTGGSA